MAVPVREEMCYCTPPAAEIGIHHALLRAPSGVAQARLL